MFLITHMHRNKQHDALALLGFILLRFHCFFFYLFVYLFIFCSSILLFCRLRHFLGRARVWLEPHKLFGHLVVGPLWEYPHDGQTRFIHGDAADQRVRGVHADLVGQFLQLQHGHADNAVLAGEAVVLHRHVQLVRLRAVFVTENAADGRQRITLTSRLSRENDLTTFFLFRRLILVLPLPLARQQYRSWGFFRPRYQAHVRKEHHRPQRIKASSSAPVRSWMSWEAPLEQWDDLTILISYNYFRMLAHSITFAIISNYGMFIRLASLKKYVESHRRGHPSPCCQATIS